MDQTMSNSDNKLAQLFVMITDEIVCFANFID